jgi:iron-sulfur cluster assembly protein/iron-sulfur cluster insertion protein
MITLTKEAAAKVSSITNDAGEGNILRIFIEPGGCSGFEYGMSMDSPKDTDEFGESNGVKYAVDGESVEYLRGTEIHFDDGLTGKGFELKNPNAQSTCGCGKSFS